MRGKLLFIAGIGVGYVLGARQGRVAYERLKGRAGEALHSPAVQRTLSTAQEFAKDRVPVVGGAVASAVGTMVDARPSDSDSASSDSRPDGA